jgi:hypothetical protein
MLVVAKPAASQAGVLVLVVAGVVDLDVERGVELPGPAGTVEALDAV